MEVSCSLPPSGPLEQRITVFHIFNKANKLDTVIYSLFSLANDT